jgi:nuclease S1
MRGRVGIYGSIAPMNRLVLIVLLGLLALPPPASAWSKRGHRLVGELAERQLQPATRSAVAELLEGEPEPSLGGVAYWADALRNDDPDRFAATSRWHYVKTQPGTCMIDRARDCPDGACVVGAIEAQSRILADTSRPRQERREALKFLVHFVGDVHQPMHAGYREDLGGNKIAIVLRTDIPPEAYARANYRDGLMQTNLHSLWDFYVLGSWPGTDEQYADRLDAPGWPARGPTLTPAAAWAAESCHVSDRPGLYPTETNLDAAYLDEFRPLQEQRVRQAAYRLAWLLDNLLAR